MAVGHGARHRSPLAGDKTNGSPDFRENAFARLTNDAVSKAPAPIKKWRRSSIDTLLRFTHASESKDLLLPHGPHRHSPPLPVKAGWRGIKPSLDALLDVAAAGSAIKTGFATRTRVQMSYDAAPLKVSVR
jgi:hypothetical protein